MSVGRLSCVRSTNESLSIASKDLLVFSGGGVAEEKLG